MQRKAQVCTEVVFAFLSVSQRMLLFPLSREASALLDSVVNNLPKNNRIYLIYKRLYLFYFLLTTFDIDESHRTDKLG